MGAITPSFVMDLESRMRVITETEYQRLLTSLWYTDIVRTSTSGSMKEIVIWLLSTANIEYRGKRGGNKFYEDVVSQIFSYEHKHAGTGLRLKRDQLQDLDGGGLQIAARWSADVGSLMAYWPQKQAALALKNGHLAASLAYDGKAFFASDHPLNPHNLITGSYANLHKTAGGASGVGAVPIDDSVTADVALTNLAKVMAYIQGIKMPNGEDPRMLEPASIFCNPRMAPRVAQLTNAKFIAQASAGGSGSADVEALIQTLGYAKPVVCKELSGYESDTTWFVSTRSATDTELGGLIYSEREPFKINWYTGEGTGTGIDAILHRQDRLEWDVDGRNVMTYGHPYAVHKCMAT